MIEPLEDHVAIRRNTPQEVSEGGLFLPASAQERRAEGTVVAVGPGKYANGERIPVGVKPGDFVLYNKYAGTEVSVGDDLLTIVKSADLICRIKED